MDAELGGALVLLALVDSTSIGTLVLPVLMLLAPGRVPVGRVLLHLGVVAGCYAALGSALALAGGAVRESAGGALDDVVGSRAGAAALVVVGLALLIGSFRLDSGSRRRRGLPDRTQRWRASWHRGGAAGAVGVALAAVGLEVATMLPYLAALGLVAAAELPAAASVGVVTAYSAVMVLPALVLLGLRLVAAGAVEPLLRRVDALAAHHADTALGWLVGIAGFLLAREGAARLLLERAAA